MISLTYDEFDSLLEKVENIPTKADTYVPAPDEIEAIMKREPETALCFLIWVDETGTETPENKNDRAYLRKWLRENLVIGDGESDQT